MSAAEVVSIPTIEMNPLSPEYQLKKTKTIVLRGDSADQKKQEILKYFHNTWEITEKLFETLTEKAFYQRADPLRHPLIFYYGHVACFFINKLRLAKVVKERINKHFESLFAIGVDEMSWDDLLSDDFKWPSIQEVKEYRDKVRATVEEAIINTPLTLPITWESPFWIVLMGIEHERIHLETSTVLIRQLPLEILNPIPFWNLCPKSRTDPTTVPTNELVPVNAETVNVQMGKSLDHPLYGWDNEYGVQEFEIPPFHASKFLVSNREYLEFVEDGGYLDEQYWTPEGWKWVQYQKKKGNPLQPLFWRKSGSSSSSNTYKLRTMLHEIPMPWDWPAEVNNLEAKAFCNWKSAKSGQSIRLLTEDEHHYLRSVEIKSDQHEWDENNPAPGNINLEYFCSSTPIDYFPGSQQFGLHDIIGNVWQHTETPIDAFKGFRVHPMYDDFSVPTFDLQHNLIKGGSWISTGNEATLDSRYAFRRHFYQHAGIRYVRSDRDVKVRSDVYERDETANLYNEFHYGPEYFGVQNFPQALAELAIAKAKEFNVHTGRALDLGCAVGRATFELSREFDYALGLDFSARFIRMAISLQEKGQVSFAVPREGSLLDKRLVTLTDLKLEDVKSKCEFFQADACNLDPRYSNYDFVLAANLIDRLYDPRVFLNMIHERINPGGVLMLASPYTWLEEYTSKSSWIGGYVDPETGAEVSTLDGLKTVLGDRFELIGEQVDLPFVIRETARKFQHSVSQVSFWRKRD